MNDGPASGGRAPLASELDLLVADVEQEGALSTAFLVGLSGKHAGKLFKVRLGESTIGRSSSSLVRLEERAASHVHAKLMLSSRGCFISDVESTNGTFVNGQRLDRPIELHAGDVIRCGTTSLGFLTDAEDDEQHTRAMARLTGNPMTGSVGASLALRGNSTPSVALTRAPTGLAHYQDGRGAAVVVAEAPGNPLQALDTLLDKSALVLQFLRRYWLLLVACASLGGGLGALSIYFKVPRAIATCEIVLRGTQDSDRRSSSDRLVDYFELADKNFVAPDLVRESVEEAHLPRSRILETVQSLELAPAGTNVFVGSYSHVDAPFAEQFLALHVKNFLERQIGRAIAVLKSEVDLLRSQYGENEAQLSALESKLRDFKQKHLDSLPENAQGQLGSRTSLQSQRDMLAAQLDRATQELALARKQLASGDAQVTRSVGRAQPYETALVGVKQQLAAARAQGFADTHPEVVKLVAQEAELLALQEQALGDAVSDSAMRADATTQALTARIGQLEVVVRTTATELATVEGRLGGLSKIMVAMPGVEAGYAELQRKLEASQSLHQRLHEQLKAKELQLEFERASVAARYEVMKQPLATEVDLVSTATRRGGVGLGAGLGLGALLSILHWLTVYAANRGSKRPATAPV